MANRPVYNSEVDTLQKTVAMGVGALVGLGALGALAMKTTVLNFSIPATVPVVATAGALLLYAAKTLVPPAKEGGKKIWAEAANITNRTLTIGNLFWAAISAGSGALVTSFLTTNPYFFAGSALVAAGGAIWGVSKNPDERENRPVGAAGADEPRRSVFQRAVSEAERTDLMTDRTPFSVPIIGEQEFTTVADALAAAMQNDQAAWDNRWVIYLRGGEVREARQNEPGAVRFSTYCLREVLKAKLQSKPDLLVKLIKTDNAALRAYGDRHRDINDLGTVLIELKTLFTQAMRAQAAQQQRGPISGRRRGVRIDDLDA